MEEIRIRKRKVDDMMVTFENVKPAMRWSTCLTALKTEYTLSFRSACQLLKCHRSWVQRYVRPHVHYIYLSSGIRDDKPSIFKPNYVKLAELELDEECMTESVWMNTQEFDQLIRDNMTCTRQTINVPIEIFAKQEQLGEFQQTYLAWRSLMHAEEKDETKIEKTYKTLIKTMVENGFEEYIFRASKYRRSKAKAVACVPREYNLNELIAVHDIKDYGDTDEQIYRKFFEKAAYRLCLELPDSNGVVSKKIYYLEPDVDERKLILSRIGIQESVEWMLMSYARFVDFATTETQYHLSDLIK